MKISTNVNPQTYHSSSKDYAIDYEVKNSEISVPKLNISFENNLSIDPVPTLLDAYNSYQNNQQASSPSIHKAPTNIVPYEMVSNNNSYQHQAAPISLLMNQNKQQNQHFSSSGFQQHYNQLHHQQQQQQQQQQSQQQQQQQQHHDSNKQQLPYIPQVPYAILTQSNNTTPISKYAKYTFNFLYVYINLNGFLFFQINLQLK